MPIQGMGGVQQPVSEYACVVYDPKTGEIRHVHLVVNLPGAEAPSREQMTENALRHAVRDDSSEMAVLHVVPSQLERGKLYRVDHANQSLVVDRERAPLGRKA